MPGEGLPRRRTPDSAAAARAKNYPEWGADENEQEEECKAYFRSLFYPQQKRRFLYISVLGVVFFLANQSCIMLEQRRQADRRRITTTQSGITFHGLKRLRRRRRKSVPDYGGLNYTAAAARTISRDDVFDYQLYRQGLVDEAAKREKEEQWFEKAMDADCQPPSWKTKLYPTCNVMHEGGHLPDVNSYPIG